MTNQPHPDTLLSVDLTKWPRLIVTGDPVTETQANDIILRTNSSYLWCNDKQWVNDVCDTLGITVDNGHADWGSVADYQRSINALDLDYLHTSRIMSTWIGGPKGWCDWDGTIGCDNYNIGKYPVALTVDEEWRKIAVAWPFLNLRCQLVQDEGEAIDPVVEWRVHDGEVEVVPPGKLMRLPHDPQFLAFLGPGGERGVSLERLVVAVAQVREQSHV